MDIYLKRKRGKILLLLVAVIIGVVSLLFTNWLSGKMANEERKKVELWAEATKRMAESGIQNGNQAGVEQLNTAYLTLIQSILGQNTTIPVLIVEPDGSFNYNANINFSEGRKEHVLKKELEKMKAHSDPIRIDLSEEDGDYLLLYYRESSILRNLRYYPLVQLIVIVVFIIAAYSAFIATQRAEQNQVWVGMSKETAHQLGTPISSLMAWIEILKLQEVDQSLVAEFEKDTLRLEKIAERFSKIGSKPELIPTNIVEVLTSAVSYLKTRSSDRVKFETAFSSEELHLIPLNAALFSWVIENLCKNAIDAMDNHGKITLALKEKENTVVIDVTDTGKGVQKSQFKTIFQPGFSTKKRGWGLGLSLAKRIVENYHQGKIFIKWSELGKGTTFRIILNK
ncbi:Signal transduction histidine kinase [Mariniphaga anaerophila]|uniref:histidine kinase n=1 Tax=Mariniphaga anaerophila TaxID=1484053 RepID=A0A1M4YVA5_9BACT|nr:HAMP domain-containing sensor histidine kinase [Mariniphaga anaerophila]SHF09422.1 Signal transduction histidine kinase [Mariniphaga anaerophila]